ncbi:MAG: O-antigen ligase family protein [Flavobacteriales bacterium]|nr:O-antigen ligase family protein [Flavobacteriales bacterium]MCB9166356.1 O-antigen ligase family protein [Flavobacteriales bacterium]
MLDYIREELQFLVILLLWVLVTIYFGPAIYMVLPLSVFLFARREAWADAVFGFLLILILSDMTPDIFAMRKIKTAKYAYIIAMSLVLFIERRRFEPLARVFPVFLPFFVYSFFPLVWSSEPIVGVSKTISYGLLYLIVPNYVLSGYRRMGWPFFRNLMYFIVTVLLMSLLLRHIQHWWVYIGGRFRGLFGNPNGLGIFTFLVFMLFSVIDHLNRDLFPRFQKLFIYGVIIYFMLECGSRTALAATLMFAAFGRVFRLSQFIGFISIVTFILLLTFIMANLDTIVIDLGLQDTLRLDTLDDASGRYIAWRFAWEHIQDFFIFGGGFGNDEWIMRHNYAYLRTLGHHGGVHNSYLTMWFNCGIMGLLIYFRSFFLIFFKASKFVPFAFAIMFSVMFSVLYESWLTGSLNPFTIILVVILTMLTEEEIVEWQTHEHARRVEQEEAAALPVIAVAGGARS